MYSESDIEAAVASGALTPAAAEALRASVAGSRAAPAVDEESFRLLTGFNDIFVSIAAVLLLVAVGWIGSSIGGAIVPGPSEVAMRAGADPDGALFLRHVAASILVGAALVAAASWSLAEYFTLRRRMALPSILLLATFALAVAGAVSGLGKLVAPDTAERGQALIAAVAGLATAGAAYLHWRRFHVPITVAALTLALVGTLLSLAFAAVPTLRQAYLWVMFACGLAVFAFAMHWDISDRARQTRRSDVAFWLHLAAAPMIAHPIFNLLGVLGGNIGPATALLVLVLYVAFGLVALAVDRRALLVSSLVYVLYALSELFSRFGAVSLNVALTALVIGSALLMLSAFWHGIRRGLVRRLPEELRVRLPEVDRPAYVAPPA